MRFGVHLNIGQGLDRVVQQALDIGCDCLQIFVRSPRVWAPTRFDEAAAAEFARRTRQLDLRPVVAHTSYLVNLATAQEPVHSQSVAAVLEDARRAVLLGCEYLVLHVGHHRGAGVEAGMAQVAANLRGLVAATAGPVFLLENTSGAGSGVGHSFEQLAEMLALADEPSRLGVCLDTCHAHVAGYDLSTTSAPNEAIGHFDRVVGLDRLLVVHANDARYPAGSHRDAHEHIGRGTIGEPGFRALLHHPGLQGKPIIAETPHDQPGEDAANLAMLRALANGGRNTAGAAGNPPAEERRGPR